jgi:hypothetical protein
LLVDSAQRFIQLNKYQSDRANVNSIDKSQTVAICRAFRNLIVPFVAISYTKIGGIDMNLKSSLLLSIGILALSLSAPVLAGETPTSIVPSPAGIAKGEPNPSQPKEQKDAYCPPPTNLAIYYSCWDKSNPDGIQIVPDNNADNSRTKRHNRNYRR